MVELKGRTRTFLGADPGSEKKSRLCVKSSPKANLINKMRHCGIFLYEIKELEYLPLIKPTHYLIEVSLIQVAPKQGSLTISDLG